MERQGACRCGDLPAWTVYCPGGNLGNSTIIEGDDGLIVYDTGVNTHSGESVAAEIAKAIVDQADVDSGAVAGLLGHALHRAHDHCDAVVEVTAADLGGDTAVTTTSGDPQARVSAV